MRLGYDAETVDDNAAEFADQPVSVTGARPRTAVE